jgi:hypothetical protein
MMHDGWWTVDGGCGGEGHAYTSPHFYPATRQELGFTEGFYISNPAESRQEAARDPAGEVREASKCLSAGTPICYGVSVVLLAMA